MGDRILEEFHPIDVKSTVGRSELIEKIGQFAPNLMMLLEGPRADPAPVPLQDKTTRDLIRLLEFGWLPSEVATIWGVERAQLSHWISSDKRRASQARLARKAQAEMWDRVAFAVGLFAPSDRVEMARAKLLMDHCKWRSSMYDPEDYVKRLAVKNTVADKTARELTTHELQIIAAGGVLPDGL